MLMGLGELRTGGAIRLVLRFERAGDVYVEASVRMSPEDEADLSSQHLHH